MQLHALLNYTLKLTATIRVQALQFILDQSFDNVIAGCLNRDSGHEPWFAANPYWNFIDFLLRLEKKYNTGVV